MNEQSISAMLDLVQTSLLDLEKSRHELNLKSELGTLGGVMIDLNRTDGRCVVIRTASGETVAVAPGEDPAAGEVGKSRGIIPTRRCRGGAPMLRSSGETKPSNTSRMRSFGNGIIRTSIQVTGRHWRMRNEEAGPFSKRAENRCHRKDAI